jgi:hypothetical protein
MEKILQASYEDVKAMLARNRDALDRCAGGVPANTTLLALHSTLSQEPNLGAAASINCQQ